MIDFHQTWLPQIIRYAGLIADEEVLRRAWLHQDQTETSVYYPNEMLEQVFGDLDAERIAREMPKQLSARAVLAVEIQAFLEQMLKWEKWLDANTDQAKWGEERVPPQHAQAVFSCEPWAILRAHARRVVSASRQP